ncbi:ANTAR domain-containing protein [Kitasatospora sp. NPDC036755]|uniref:ANTAR domain-containing protein n=1 Tax=Kitasatospora sp. NPDC036755 TaxID=3154600 RepID=UPI00340B9A95
MRDDTAVLREAVDRLRAEAEGLRRAMRTRGVIEQAKGMLAERLDCTPEEAFEHLVRLSQDTNRRLVDLAAGLVGIAAPLTDPEERTGPAPPAAASQVSAPPPPPLFEPPPPFPVPPPGTVPPPFPVPPPGTAAPAAAVPGLAARYHLAA